MGNPVVHWELMSKDPAKVAAFYEKIVGWKIQHIPEMNYRLVETGGEGGINGGILKPERAGPWPGNMTLYIDVDDLAAYRKRIVAEGGNIHVEEQDVPGMGAFTLFTDPEGRMIGIVEAGQEVVQGSKLQQLSIHNKSNAKEIQHHGNKTDARTSTTPPTSL